MTDRIDSVKDLILFNASPEEFLAMSRKIKRYKRWLVITGLPNDLDSWQSYCEMTANEE